MSTLNAATTGSLSSSALTQALESLKNYDSGSGRGSLMPLDKAVADAVSQAAVRAELEQRLVAALNTCSSVPAREYICSKLAVLGSARCVPALLKLLDEPDLVTAACNALEANPSPKAAKALRQVLDRLPHLGKIAAINSLGIRRDSDAVGALTKMLQGPDLAVAQAAAAALGLLGSPKAGEMLMKFQSKAPAGLRPALADGLLNCAERLRSNGQGAAAEKLCRSILSARDYPAHVQEAARRALPAKG